MLEKDEHESNRQQNVQQRFRHEATAVLMTRLLGTEPAALLCVPFWNMAISSSSVFGRGLFSLRRMDASLTPRYKYS